MGELVQPPFQSLASDAARVQMSLAELGLVGRAPYAVIGVSALRLSGYVQYFGRTEVLVSPGEYGRLRTDDNEFTSLTPGRHGEDKNKKLVIDVPNNGDQQSPIHVISWWDPATDDLEKVVTYDAMRRAKNLDRVHDMRIVNPVTSIRWLLALGYEKDRSAGLKALSSLRRIDRQAAQPLYQRARDVWPPYRDWA